MTVGKKIVPAKIAKKGNYVPYVPKKKKSAYVPAKIAKKGVYVPYVSTGKKKTIVPAQWDKTPSLLKEGFVPWVRKGVKPTSPHAIRRL